MNTPRFRTAARAACLALALVAASCELMKLDSAGDATAPTDTTVPLPEASFLAPDGVVLAGDYAFVANTGFEYANGVQTFQPGFVTVVKLSDLAVVNRIPTSRKNPQSIAFAGGKVLVLCSGETKLSGKLVVPATEASLDVIDPATAATAGAPTASIVLPLSSTWPLVGYPSSMVVSQDGSLVLAGSGTSSALFAFDVANRTVTAGTSSPLKFGSADPTFQDGITIEGNGGTVLFGASFDRNLLYGVDMAAGGAPILGFEPPLAIGKTSAIEGAVDVLYLPGSTPDLLVLMNLSSSITAVTTAFGQASVVPGWFKTGVDPYRMVVQGTTLYVVNRGDNNISAYDLPTRKTKGTAVAFPAGTNPHSLAVTKRDGAILGYVSARDTNRLYEVDLSTGSVLREAK
jgi:hypothetical protein